VKRSITDSYISFVALMFMFVYGLTGVYGTDAVVVTFPKVGTITGYVMVGLSLILILNQLYSWFRDLRRWLIGLQGPHEKREDSGGDKK